MKIRGTTITTPLARSAVADDTGVSKKTWSSKNTVDKLCPTFTESGAVVVCEPVEGYPLEVTAQDGATITRCGKNLSMANEKGTFTGTVTRRFATPLPAGKYTWSYGSYECGGDLAPNVVPFDESGTAFGGCGFIFNETSNKYKTFTVAKPIYGMYLYSNGWAVQSRDITSTINQLQLEIGDTATAYEPCKAVETFAQGEEIPAFDGVNTLYADSGEITVTGKADLVAIINKLSATIMALTGV